MVGEGLSAAVSPREILKAIPKDVNDLTMVYPEKHYLSFGPGYEVAIKSWLHIVGHQNFSIYAMTSCVPSSWLTYGGSAGLYIASVISRTSITFRPHRTICLMPGAYIP